MSAYLTCEIEELAGGPDAQRTIDALVRRYLPDARCSEELPREVDQDTFYGCWVIPYGHGSIIHINRLIRKLSRFHQPQYVNVCVMMRTLRPSLWTVCWDKLQTWWGAW